MKNSIFFVVLLAIILVSCKIGSSDKNTIIDMNWQFKGIADSTWMDAEVPGSVHTDLLANGKIEDPYYRMNEHDCQWVDKKDWEYKTNFSVDPSILSSDKVELVFKGLDTYATIFINGKQLAKTDNMFMEWNIECKEYLIEGLNELKILFESPINKGLNKRDELGYFLPGAENDQSQLGGLEDVKTCVFSRKAQYHFGWDWGPRLVSTGIWQEVELEAWNKYKIREVFVESKSVLTNVANLSIVVEIEAIFPGRAQLKAEISNGRTFIFDEILDVGINHRVYSAEVVDPELWWPNGLGDQIMYDLDFSIIEKGKVIDNVRKNFGLRKIEIIQEGDNTGNSFFFKVNGKPVFMKGANYIPQDIFLHRVSNEDYERLIKDAVEANMNMIRVWGGGIYEKDIFYDLCDKYGLLVWQDFMFACAMYPGNEEFLDNVKKEAIQNVKRLRGHPSIALWCGDNEILSAWNRWGWKENVLENQGEEIVQTVWQAYDTLFHSILPKVVKHHDPQRLFWPSSPSAGFGELENWKSGDVHYWGVWWGKEPFSNYKKKIGRFMSEYGFQSFPDLNTVNKYTIPEDHDIYSEVMKSHQRSSIGNGTIDEYMKRDYRQPKDFPMFLYVNHILQAEGIKMAMEAHRRNMPFCMGSLYWQLNDVWPVASWAGIDYFGNWKALHYFVKKAFEPVLISPVLYDDDQIEVFVISDKLADIEAIINIEILDFEGKEIWSENKKVTLASNMAQSHFRSSLNDLLKGKERNRHFLNVRVEDHEGAILSQNILYFLPVKDLNLPQPGLEYELKQNEEGISVSLSTESLAKNVYLYADGLEGRFSDNYFDLPAGNSMNVQFISDTHLTLEQLKNNLKVYSLVDSY